MQTLDAILIAIIEGITEFLPISSTAHIKITNFVLNVSPTPFTEMFDVVIQLAAILSVVTVYHKLFFTTKSFRLYTKLLVAVIPALLAGYFLKSYIAHALSNLTFIAWVMIGGGIVLIYADRWFSHPTTDKETAITYKQSFFIGCFQVLSIVLPGLSRSAATIIGGMSQKLTRQLAAQFSFCLAVPTMFAASAKSFLDVYQTNPEVLVKDNFVQLGIGALVAYIVALLSIRFLIRYLQNHGFKVFGYYRVIVGSFVLIMLYYHKMF